MAVLVPKLIGLRAEITEVAPNRDTESDGWIGNANHQTYVSGHNPDETGLAEFSDPDNVDEVRAIDVDADLRQPGLTMTMIAEYLRKECKAGHIDWIYYIIWNRKIASARENWKWRDYGGYNAHTRHMHVSGNLKSDTGPYRKVGLQTLRIDMLTNDDIAKIANAVITNDDVAKIANAVITRLDTAPIRNGRTVGGTLDALAELAHAINANTATILQAVTADPGNTVSLSPEQIEYVTTQLVNGLGRALITGGTDLTDEE